MKKRIWFLVLGIMALALLIVLSGCPANSDEDPPAKPEPYPGNPSGTATASTRGYGGLVTVTITMEDGYITQALVTGDHETGGVGSEAVRLTPAAIIAKNSHEIDGISGVTATITLAAIKKAAKEAIDEILAEAAQP